MTLPDPSGTVTRLVMLAKMRLSTNPDERAAGRNAMDQMSGRLQLDPELAVVTVFTLAGQVAGLEIQRFTSGKPQLPGTSDTSLTGDLTADTFVALLTKVTISREGSVEQQAAQGNVNEVCAALETRPSHGAAAAVALADRLGLLLTARP